MGFPIRKSADQSFFAAPHGLSQRSTSFIASQRQGIHRMLLRHLIVLILNTHHSAWLAESFRVNGFNVGYRGRKTSLLQDRSDGECGQALRQHCAARDDHLAMTIPFGRMEIACLKAITTNAAATHTMRRSERSPLYDVRQLATAAIIADRNGCE